MNASNRDALSAVVARQRGRARLRSATIALGAASLVAAGAVAYTLPGGMTNATSGTSAAVAPVSSGTAVHTTSGGSAVVTTTNGSAGAVSTPAAASRSGSSHATSGGS
jgi:hypothetical protein